MKVIYISDSVPQHLERVLKPLLLPLVFRFSFVLFSFLGFAELPLQPNATSHHNILYMWSYRNGGVISPPSRPVSFSCAQKNKLGISLTAAWQPNDKCARLYNHLKGFTGSTQSPTHKFLNPQGSQKKKKNSSNWGDVSFTAALYNLISLLTTSDISSCTTACDCIHKRSRAAGSCSHLHAQRSPRHTWEWFSEQCGSLMNPEHRFRFNNPNWRDYRSGKTSAPPCLHFNPPPSSSSSPSLPPSSSSLLRSTPPPLQLSLLTPWPPPPHHSRVISKKKGGFNG